MKYILLTIVLLSNFMITGCGATKYLSTDRSNPIVAFVDDQSLATKATSAISKNKELWEKSNINAISYDNAVLIIGQVPGQELKQQVEEIVSGVPKVTTVYNQLSIKEPISFLSSTHDSWITATAKAKLIAEPGLDSGTIKVITEDRTVYLMGNPDPEYRDVVLDIIKNISGVEQVVDVFS